MLTYHCPTTARVVHSSIEASEAEVQRLRELRLSLWCPYCRVGHASFGKDMQVVADVAPLRLDGTINSRHLQSSAPLARRVSFFHPVRAAAARAAQVEVRLRGIGTIAEA